MSGNKNLQMSGNICFEDCLENILRGRRDLKHNLQNWRWFWETIFRKGIVIVYQFLSMLNEIFQSVIRHIINYTRRQKSKIYSPIRTANNVRKNERRKMFKKIPRILTRDLDPVQCARDEIRKCVYTGFWARNGSVFMKLLAS